MAALYVFLTLLFGVHAVVFGRMWLRRGGWRYLCLVGTFATLTTIYALKYGGVLGPFHLSLNPEMALRTAAVGFSGAAVVGYIRQRRSR
jgi:hypothetical protein